MQTGEFMTDNDDLLIEEDLHGEDDLERHSWKILIADDDEQVHLVTRLVLEKMRFEGKPVECISTHSGEETKAYLRNTNDVAILLLDVVMKRRIPACKSPALSARNYRTPDYASSCAPDNQARRLNNR